MNVQFLVPCRVVWSLEGRTEVLDNLHIGGPTLPLHYVLDNLLQKLFFIKTVYIKFALIPRRK